jgi:hypothetical protein
MKHVHIVPSEDGGDIFLLIIGLTFNGLHVVMSPMIELFINTAVRTPNPA